MRRSLVLAAVLAAFAVPAAAQTLGTPIFKAPTRTWKSTELGGYISDPGEQFSVAVEGQYRIGRPKYDFGFVLGYADTKGNGDGLFGIGIDVRAPVAKATKDFPLDAAFTAGFGALFTDGANGFLVPIGVTIGRQVILEDSKISFTPYVNPVIAPSFGDLFDDIQFGLGIGVDVSLSPRFDVRVAGSLGDIEGVSIGGAWHR
jgi:hypothetical protein